jgi:Icc-related predicted phosphoesterase
MRVCHFSDWHSDRNKLPAADLYVCTGDMLPNFPVLLCQDKWKRQPVRFQANMHYFKEGEAVPPGWPVGREFDPSFEEVQQKRWIKEVLGSYRDLMPAESRDNPVICIRGNHDFCDLSDAFGGDVWEVNLDPSRTTVVHGLKVGGCRGIPQIVGEWSDEFEESGKPPEGLMIRPAQGNFDDVVTHLPTDLEILLTHAPPYGMLDAEGAHYGSRAVRSWLNERMYAWGKVRAHFFGHVHMARGSRSEAGILFSNAARGHLVYEL